MLINVNLTILADYIGVLGRPFRDSNICLKFNVKQLKLKESLSSRFIFILSTRATSTKENLNKLKVDDQYCRNHVHNVHVVLH